MSSVPANNNRRYKIESESPYKAKAKEQAIRFLISTNERRRSRF